MWIDSYLEWTRIYIIYKIEDALLLSLEERES